MKLPTDCQNVMNAFSTLPRRIMAEKHKGAINILMTKLTHELDYCFKAVHTSVQLGRYKADTDA